MIFSKKNIFIISYCFLFVFSTANAFSPVTAYFFWDDDCPTCQENKELLDSVRSEYPQLYIKDYNVSEGNNSDILEKVSKDADIDASKLPVLIIGNDKFSDLKGPEAAEKIETKIKECINGCPDIVASTAGLDSRTEEEKKGVILEEKPTDIAIEADNTIDTLLGKIDPTNIPIIGLTVIFAILDGLNLFGVWLFLSLLIVSSKQKKALFLGSVFIAASFLICFFSLTGTINFGNYFQFLPWMKAVGAILILFVGIGLIKKYLATDDEPEKKTKQGMTIKEKIIYSLVMIAAAKVIYFIGFVASSPLAITYADNVKLLGLLGWQNYLLFFLYSFLFVLDDIIILLFGLFLFRNIHLGKMVNKKLLLIIELIIIFSGIFLIVK